MGPPCSLTGVLAATNGTSLLFNRCVGCNKWDILCSLTGVLAATNGTSTLFNIVYLLAATNGISIIHALGVLAATNGTSTLFNKCVVLSATIEDMQHRVMTAISITVTHFSACDGCRN